MNSLTVTEETVNIKYETARGDESPSLRKVDDVSINDPYYGYDYVLRGEVEGWGSHDLTIPEYLLEELQDDVNAARDPVDPIILNQWGVEYDSDKWDAIVGTMDDEIVEDLHARFIDNRQEFFDAYAEEHEKRYGVEWELNKPNPQW